MRAILIDPFSCTISEIDHDGGYPSIYPTLSHESMPVHLFDAVRLDDGDAIFIDYEGLDKTERFFALKDGVQPYAGKGLVLGSDEEGSSAPAKTSLAWIKEQVLFLTYVEGHFVINDIPWQANEVWSLI